MQRAIHLLLTRAAVTIDDSRLAWKSGIMKHLSGAD